MTHKLKFNRIFNIIIYSTNYTLICLTGNRCVDDGNILITLILTKLEGNHVSAEYGYRSVH